VVSAVRVLTTAGGVLEELPKPQTPREACKKTTKKKKKKTRKKKKPPKRC